MPELHVNHLWIGSVLLLCIALFDQGVQSLPYFGFLVMTILIWQRLSQHGKSDLEFQREGWFRSNLRHLGITFPNGSAMSRKLFPLHSRRTGYTELGIGSETEYAGSMLPDIIAMEKETSKLEERASVILGSLIFFPVLFALLHLFRSVSLSIFLIELTATIILGWGVISSQEVVYRMKGWDDALNYLITSRDILVSNPWSAIATTSPLGGDYQMYVLGKESRTIADRPSNTFLDNIFQVLMATTPSTRGDLIDHWLFELRSLPQLLESTNQRWEAYRGRMILISTSSTALGSLFVSLVITTFPELSTLGFELSGTTYLAWGQLILIISLNFRVWSNWVDTGTRIKLLIMVCGVYSIFLI